MGQVSNRVGTRKGDSELLWDPGFNLTPSWALVSTWLALATKGPAGLSQGKDRHPAVGQGPRHRMRRHRKAERK